MHADNPVADAARYYEERRAEADRIAGAIEYHRQQFTKAIAAGANSLAFFAKQVRDWKRQHLEPDAKRYQTVAEVLFDELEEINARDEVMHLLLCAAKGENVQTRAQDLIERATTSYAEREAEA